MSRHKIVVWLSQSFGMSLTPMQRHGEAHGQDRLGRSALHWAAVRNDTERAKKLLETTSSIWRQWHGDQDGATPLHEATLRGHKDIVVMFLGFGAIRGEIDEPDHQGRTALHWAIVLEKNDIAQLLIHAGADGSRQDKWKNKTFSEMTRKMHVSPMPLHFEEVKQVKNLINLLLDQNEIGSAISILKTARDYGRDEHVRDSCATENHSRQGRKYFWNLMKNLWSFVEEYWPVDSARVSFTLEDEDGKTPLTNAPEEEHYGLLVRLILANEKADVNFQDKEGRTLLSHAAGRGFKAVVKLLLDSEVKDLDVDPKDNDNRTPLSYAAEKGHRDVVELLVATGKVDKALTSKSSKKHPYLYAASVAPGHLDAVLLGLLR